MPQGMKMNSVLTFVSNCPLLLFLPGSPRPRWNPNSANTSTFSASEKWSTYQRLRFRNRQLMVAEEASRVRPKSWRMQVVQRQPPSLNPDCKARFNANNIYCLFVRPLQAAITTLIVTRLTKIVYCLTTPVLRSSLTGFEIYCIRRPSS
jgi:hypothetical protein